MSATEVTLIQGDCLEVMGALAPQSINMIFADLPYGALKQMAWDVPICPQKLWQSFSRICAFRAPQIFTANMRFAASLIASNYRMFSYEMIWEKSLCTAPFLAKKRPLPVHEMVLVFNKPAVYNPQMREESTRAAILPNWRGASSHKNKFYLTEAPNNTRMSGPMYPRSVLRNMCGDRRKNVHPTQKPVALLEYLIKTYTKSGDTILDPVAGSGTTSIAAINVGDRKVICIEKDPTYFEVMQKRVAEHKAKLGLA